MVSDYAVANNRAVLGTYVKDGKPYVDLLIPAIMDAHTFLLADYPHQAKEFFEYTIVIGFIHELDHLATGLVGSKEDLVKLIDHETKVWALTCEYGIRPMVEVHGVTIGSSDAEYYEDWLKSGRDAESSFWKMSIRRVYSGTRQIR
jgi:hypothetical protein